jgi:SEC-C motif-containing protein
MNDCPCKSGQEFDACCGALLKGTLASTPEALMRARFTAFVTGDIDFLERTMAGAALEDYDRHAVEKAMAGVEGQGVEVRAASSDGDEASVEYIARFKSNGKPIAHHERASFQRRDGVWLYVDGEVNPKGPPRQVDKVGRNDPCPCGSGKKYKKCCGR